MLSAFYLYDILLSSFPFYLLFWMTFSFPSFLSFLLCVVCIHFFFFLFYLCLNMCVCSMTFLCPSSLLTCDNNVCFSRSPFSLSFLFVSFFSLLLFVCFSSLSLLLSVRMCLSLFSLLFSVCLFVCMSVCLFVWMCLASYPLKWTRGVWGYIKWEGRREGFIDLSELFKRFKNEEKMKKKRRKNRLKIDQTNGHSVLS